MTTEHEMKRKSPASPLLPWLVAGGALLVFLTTINHWVTLGNLSQVVQLAGWSGQLPYSAPLYFLVTYPLKWLPASWLPLALNLFAAVCAGFTLALLARSVMLLPHDRTRDQRVREQSEFSLLSIRAAWLPPVLAVLACGLQLTFWENATAGTGETFDLLLFAYVIRCLLEYRIDQRPSWLTRFAFIYGLAITNNWAMIGFAPAFLVALIWIKGLDFFNWRFIGRMVCYGLLGLSLYLLLPLIQSYSDLGQASFWQTLKTYWLAQKNVLLGFPRYLILMLGFTSLVPVFVMGIRWASSVGETSQIGIKLTTLMFHVLHGIFLVACTVVAFDPSFSPRKLGLGIPFLTFYYLGALSIGYFSGYFLLVFGKEPTTSRGRVSFFQSALNRTIVAIVWLGLIVVPVGLAYQNLPRIQANNTPVLRQYAALLAKSLPANGAVVLSDDPRKLYLLAATLSQSDAANKYILLDTFSLKLANYHKFLSTHYPQHWPYRPATNNPTGLIEDVSLMKVMFDLSKSNEVYYLHPSFGYYFEEFYSIPHGLVHQLKSYSTKTINPPSLTSEVIAENEAFWKQIENDVLSPLPHLIKQRSVAAMLVGNFYSCALNYWGVVLQRANRLEEAATCFTRALESNPGNAVAQINRDCNQNLRGGKRTSPEVPKSLDWERIFTENGPFDEPNFCFEQGRVFTRGALYRQAAQQFDRVKALAPDNVVGRLWLGQLMILGRLPDQALELVTDIRAQPDLLPLNRTNEIELIRLEASAYFTKTNSESAEQILQAALKKYPEDRYLFATVTQVEIAYGRHAEALAIVENLLRIAPNDPQALLIVTQVQMACGRHAEALATVEQLLKIAPDDPQALLSKGALCIQLKTFKEAIAPLTRLLTLQPDNNAALINRAIAHLQIGDLDAAQSDYEKLKTAFPSGYRVYYGLGEIAYQKKARQAAIKNYEIYLKYAPPNTEESKLIKARLKELKGGSS